MFIFNIFKRKKILNTIENKNKTLRIIIYMISVTLVAISYNLFFVPNDLVIGGMSGLAIVVKKVTGLNTSIFLLITTVISLILSLIFLGKKQTKENLIGAIVYPVMVSITEPITSLFNISFNSYLFTCLVAIITYSIPLGIIYRTSGKYN